MQTLMIMSDGDKFREENKTGGCSKECFVGLGGQAFLRRASQGGLTRGGAIGAKTSMARRIQL